MNRITGSILILHGRTPKIVIQPFRVQLYRINRQLDLEKHRLKQPASTVSPLRSSWSLG